VAKPDKICFFALALCGVSLRGVAWHGMVWRGMTWLGVEMSTCRLKALGKFGIALGLTYIFGVAIVFPDHSIVWEILFIVGLAFQGWVTTGLGLVPKTAWRCNSRAVPTTCLFGAASLVAYIPPPLFLPPTTHLKYPASQPSSSVDQQQQKGAAFLRTWVLPSTHNPSGSLRCCLHFDGGFVMKVS
jgi:hypothetical protein